MEQNFFVCWGKSGRNKGNLRKHVRPCPTLSHAAQPSGADGPREVLLSRPCDHTLDYHRLYSRGMRTKYGQEKGPADLLPGDPGRKGGQCPVRYIAAWPVSVWRNSYRRRLWPIPGFPTSLTTCPWPLAALTPRGQRMTMKHLIDWSSSSGHVPVNQQHYLE
jgi:hypothetical protein